VRHLIWSFFERFFPRAASSAITLILATFLSPAGIGVYSWVIIGLTFYQSVTDAAVRQIAVPSVSGHAGLNFLRKYSWWSAVSGGLALVALLLVLALTLPNHISGQAWLLLPVVVIPAVTAVRAKYVAYLQKGSEWRLLAGAQLFAAAFSFAVSIPLLILTRSLLATAIQLALTEFWFSAQVILAARKKGWARYAQALPQGDSPAREFRHISAYSLLGWLQGQGDRLLIALMTGPATLGLYAFAWSLSRSVGDAVSNSTANVLRPVIVQSPKLSSKEIARNADRLLLRSLVMSAAIVIVTSTVSKYVMPLILDRSWDSSLNLVPIMSLSIIPTLLAWSLTVILMATGSLRWATPIKGVGVGLGVVVAFAALVNLELAAWVLVLRETIVLGLMLLVARAAVPWKAVNAGFALLGILSILTLIVF
jgi:O-antigen/teichoic acid export membrane protein